MRKHDEVRSLLAGYTDQALDDAGRRDVDAHLQDCAECANETASLRRLNTLLADFPTAPPIAFHPFWAKLQIALPVPAQKRAPWFTPNRRLALSLAIAALAAVAVSATVFASEAAMPDNPLYTVKRAGEQVQLTLALDQKARVHLQVRLAAQRLREAQVMAGREKPLLAVAALKDFDELLNAAEPRLKHPATEQEREAVVRIITALRLQLAGVEDINERQDDDDLAVKASVRIAERALDRGEPAESEPSVEPTPPVSETPDVRQTDRPRVEPSGTPEPNDSSSGGHH